MWGRDTAMEDDDGKSEIITEVSLRGPRLPIPFNLAREHYLRECVPRIVWLLMVVKVLLLLRRREYNFISFSPVNQLWMSVGCSFWRLSTLFPKFHLLLRESHFIRDWPPQSSNSEEWLVGLVNISVDEILIYGCINFSSVNL